MLLRHVIDDATFDAIPVTVLADSAEATVLRISVGSRWLAAHDAAGRRVHVDADRWMLAPVSWVQHDATYVISPAQWFAIALMTEPITHAPLKWYVNAQTPFRRTNWGFDTLDLELDMECDLSLRRRVKDVERFRRIIGHVISSEEAELVLRGMVCAGRRLRNASWVATARAAAAASAKIPDLDAALNALPLPADLVVWRMTGTRA